jgi:hypothetical protein
MSWKDALAGAAVAATMSFASTAFAAVCGDGVLDSAEMCDDGNLNGRRLLFRDLLLRVPRKRVLDRSAVDHHGTVRCGVLRSVQRPG